MKYERQLAHINMSHLCRNDQTLCPLICVSSLGKNSQAAEYDALKLSVCCVSQVVEKRSTAQHVTAKLMVQSIFTEPKNWVRCGIFNSYFYTHADNWREKSRRIVWQVYCLWGQKYTPNQKTLPFLRCGPWNSYSFVWVIKFFCFQSELV